MLAQTSALVPSKHWPLAHTVKVCTGLVGVVILVALLTVAYIVLRDTGLLATILNPES